MDSISLLALLDQFLSLYTEDFLCCYRHYILNQWVVLCLTSMQSLNTRVALLNKLIQVARSLQGIGFADIFGFMALMSGLLAQQVCSQ